LFFFTGNTSYERLYLDYSKDLAKVKQMFEFLLTKEQMFCIINDEKNISSPEVITVRKKYVLKNKKRFFLFIFVLTVLTASIFAMPSAYGYNGKECVTVIVKEGDTLWNIASSHYENGDIRKTHI